ncbi:amine oxidase [Methanosalsum zhilinae DSM 4017]|uniref:Amine oxidase n=1 Tax=Methanosalsum zhilinae (strain DSM 4017 / NBRC 107636 / OCM 62 / WeN5) TaxID=679901 RepID=F7XPL0_METZD|nr:amine oxidase [Methanosalsum zhilinae DSM 4017]
MILKATIIGAGLGGLLSAAKLARSGYDVEVFERLPVIGGRFTNIDHKGYKLSTGALHMIPHGPSGPLAQILRDVGAEVEIVRSRPMSVIRMPADKDSEDYKGGYVDMPFNHFTKPFSFINRLKIAFYTTATKIFPPKEGSFQEWFSKHIHEDWTYRIADSFCGWSLSLRSSDVPAKEAFEIFSNLYRYSGSGVPIGGCEAVIRALEDVIVSCGGRIHTGHEVSEIITENGNATGILCEGNSYSADIVISNLGHRETARICPDLRNKDNYKEYLDSLEKIKPSAGVKICLGAEEPLIGHGGVLLTPYARRVNGINEVTNIDPGLAPPGKHLVMAHQCTPWDRIDHLEEEIELGLRDLEEIFTGKNYEVLMVQSYHNGWPVNRAGSGQDIGNTTPIESLFVVGDGAKGHGGIEVEGIALGVSGTMKKIIH